MDIEVAITTALQFENRVVSVYQEAAAATADPAGKRVFETLVREEKRHVAYLEYKLEELKKTGRVTPERLETIIPPKERIEACVHNLRAHAAAAPRESELRLLRKALQVETETGGFYKSIVRELPPEGQAIFDRFIEIEMGHAVIVQAQIDAVSGLGFWFDMPEFHLEGE
jgi:rubrerythrin